MSRPGHPLDLIYACIDDRFEHVLNVINPYNPAFLPSSLTSMKGQRSPSTKPYKAVRDCPASDSVGGTECLSRTTGTIKRATPYPKLCVSGELQIHFKCRDLVGVNRGCSHAFDQSFGCRKCTIEKLRSGDTGMAQILD
ncbi:uncharacterized protein L3040_008259 [Drepanopeziza brunnea f. sp. 'multigermtubi']|uniref:uncharacterized protein n=1 Tax=Drepanopeziza brunnea f. sp. 'multigermtubi' TaxID=698441 RepID=UPI002398B6F7|nr:hypothetical protein L3040_008259 [Drepanopeziza brunnea f. sp. 'multigermtubi']